MARSELSIYLKSILVDLLKIDSPSGYTDEIIDYLETEFLRYPQLKLQRTNKGALLMSWEGKNPEKSSRALVAHVDTFGAVVKQIKDNGRIKISRIGNFGLNTVETEGCWVHTQKGKKIRGAFLPIKASLHIYGHDDLSYDVDSMEVRLTEFSSSKVETLALGINVGDFISFDSRVEINNGFISSRFLDNKAGAAILLTAIKMLYESNRQPSRTTYFLFSNLDEVGYGAPDGIPPSVAELVAVDMAAVGTGQESDEFSATICIKDASGPYHHGLSNHLRQLAHRYKIPHHADVFPYAGPTVNASMRSGRDLAVALIGPGVDASHSYERTHIKSLLATAQWVIAYLMS